MTHRRTLPPARSRAAMLAALALSTILWSACSDLPSTPPATPAAAPQLAAARSEDVRAAIAAQERHTAALMRIPGVVGTAVGLLPNGKAAVRVFLAKPDVQGVPADLDGVPVSAQVTGLFVALSDPTTRQRPAPLGFSVGHPAITAGTIGARVVDAAGNVYVLSNNHVLANSNDAAIGDAALQPGPYDGGTAADQIGTLFRFKPIDFSGGNNTIDAAIALSNVADLSNATPSDDGYGAPAAKIWGDADNNGVFDDKSALLNLPVMKYGRTTKLTRAKITGINGTVSVCYEAFLGILCLKSATYVDQILIDASGFSGGGDSGSLIVTDDANKNPVALLFAGSSTQTIGNRIDLVLGYFGVSVDGGSTAPPAPLTDVAVAGVGVPAFVTQGTTVTVSVTVKNVGNQSVGAFDVSLQDATDNAALGTQSVASLAPGATATLTFPWNTTSSSLGGHTLAASHTLTDDNAANNQGSAATTVNAPGTAGAMHVGDLDGFPSGGSTSWSTTVEVTVHDASHQPLNGATVVGKWSIGGLNSDTCTTGENGGTGTCIFLASSIKKSVKSVTFTVTSVTASGQTYLSTANHDPDGSSNGTSVTVNKP